MNRLEREERLKVSSPKIFGFPEQQRRGPFGHFDVLTPVEFLSDLRETLTNAQERIWLKTMHLEQGEISQILLEYLRAAHQRGVKIRLHIDHFSTLLPGRWYPPNLVKELIPGQGWKLREQRKKDKALFGEFGQIAEELTFTNPPRGIVDKVIPMRGRDHRKITIVDGKVAYLGGLNYFDWDFKRPDFMVKVTDPHIIAELARQFDSDSKPENDFQRECTQETRLLVDCGKPRHSLILDRAVELVNQATSISVISPLMPDGKFLEALNQAWKRRAKIGVITSTPVLIPEVSVRILNEINLVVSEIKNKLPPVFSFYSGGVHAKLLIAEISGAKIAIFGSHNFYQTGVDAGTAEITLESTNPTLIKNLENFYVLLKKALDSHFQ